MYGPHRLWSLLANVRILVFLSTFLIVPLETRNVSPVCLLIVSCQTYLLCGSFSIGSEYWELAEGGTFDEFSTTARAVAGLPGVWRIEVSCFAKISYFSVICRHIYLKRPTIVLEFLNVDDQHELSRSNTLCFYSHHMEHLINDAPETKFLMSVFIDHNERVVFARDRLSAQSLHQFR